MSQKIPVSKVLVENSSGKFLAVRDRESGKWELPGGKIEDGEDFLEAGRRELKEEVNLDSSDLRKLVRIEVEDGNHVSCWMLYTDGFKGDIVLEDQLEEFRWVSADEFYRLDWKTHAGYDIPVMKRIEEFT